MLFNHAGQNLQSTIRCTFYLDSTLHEAFGDIDSLELKAQASKCSQIRSSSLLSKGQTSHFERPSERLCLID